MKLSTTDAKKLKRALLVAMRTLYFYADPDTYFAIGVFPDPPCGDFIRDFSAASDYKSKPGKRARKAISKVNEILGLERP